MEAHERISKFLKRSQWTTMRLAIETKLHESMVSKLSRGEREVSIETALRLEIVTAAAKKRGEFKGAALRAEDLLTPEQAALLARRAVLAPPTKLRQRAA